MVGSMGNSFMDSREEEEEKTELLWPEELELANGKASESNGAGEDRAIVLGRNMHTVSFAIKEPESDDELTGEREGYMASVLAKYRKSLVERTKHHLGYPYNLDLDYGALSQLQHFSINNLGDPFIESNYGVHSRQFEVGVLDWFARLWELEKHEYWGYITNCGTEGNLHGILVGRESFPDGILYASRESHYSVFKAARMYRMQCVKVDTLTSGEIDCMDFRAKLLDHKCHSTLLLLQLFSPSPMASVEVESAPVVEVPTDAPVATVVEAEPAPAPAVEAEPAPAPAVDEPKEEEEETPAEEAAAAAEPEETPAEEPAAEPVATEAEPAAAEPTEEAKPEAEPEAAAPVAEETTDPTVEEPEAATEEAAAPAAAEEAAAEPAVASE